MQFAVSTTAFRGKPIEESIRIAKESNFALEFRSQGIFIAVVSIGDNIERHRLFKLLAESGFETLTLVHPKAFVNESAKLGRGCIVCEGAIICADVKLGSNVLVNAGAIVDHETIVEDDVHIGSGSKIAGRVKIGQKSFLRIWATVIEKKRLAGMWC